VNLLLAFLILTFLVAVRAASKNKPSRAWVLLGVSFFVAFAYLAQRTY
jgi:hypothetical protein